MGTDQHSDRDGTLFEIARDALIAVSHDGTVRRVNAAAVEQAGLPEAEYVGRPFWELLHPADRDAAVTALHDVLRDGRTERPVRYRLMHADGSTRWVEAHASTDPASGLIYAIARDVTDRENAEVDRLTLAFADAPLAWPSWARRAVSCARTRRSRACSG